MENECFVLPVIQMVYGIKSFSDVTGPSLQERNPKMETYGGEIVPDATRVSDVLTRMWFFFLKIINQG